MKKIFVLTLIWFFAIPTMLTAQSLIISGKIVDSTGKPVPNASVRIKGTNKGTIADANGNFSLAASPNSVLQISSSGYGHAEVPVKGTDNLSITLTSTTQELEQVVFVG